jgi:hypothetical protein
LAIEAKKRKLSDDQTPEAQPAAEVNANTDTDDEDADYADLFTFGFETAAAATTALAEAEASSSFPQSSGMMREMVTSFSDDSTFYMFLWRMDEKWKIDMEVTERGDVITFSFHKQVPRL